MTPAPLRFLLNDTPVTLAEVAPEDTLLDWLRLNRRLTGTKEGCNEGDCGACTVLAGRLDGDRLVYEPVNACIRLLPACHRTHIVTIEHLCGADRRLHPVQRAMIDRHGSQCGFCTPGIVMALAALWLEGGTADPLRVETALQGNLCRCTGYAPIVAAAVDALRAGGQADDPLVAGRGAVAAALAAIPPGADVARDGRRAIVPDDADALAEAAAALPDATLVAGATDVGLWITKHLRRISPAIFCGHLLRGIEDGRDAIRLEAGVSYEDALPVLAAAFPGLRDYWLRIGGWQVRCAGTVGGNIANGSPIGDSPPALIALGARLVLRHGADRRTIALEDFFLAYGKQDRRPGEIVEAVEIPRRPGALVAAYKVSKRVAADISAVAAGFCVKVEGGTIADARIAFGGMDGIPRRAGGAEAALRGAPFAADSFEAAARAAEADFTPLSDWRASADYRRALAGNLVRRFWLEHGAAAEGPVRLDRAVGG